MLDIAYELVGQATSNSLLMFCFCNLIIVIILTGSSKPGSMDSQDYNTFTTPVSFNSLASEGHDYCDDDDDHEDMIVIDVLSAQDESLTDPSIIPDADKESCHCCHDDDDDDDDNEEEDDDESYEADVEEEEEDGELRKRAEEFIAKVNNEWKHEKLRALNLVY